MSLTEGTNSVTISACRSCGGKELVKVLDLGRTPLANRLIAEDELDQDEPTYPLVVVACPACSLVQLTETVSPEVLFRDYVYFSSVSDALLAHSKQHADELVRTRRLGKGSRVIEAASNDGYLLKWFQPYEVDVLGVEPARNIAMVANQRGIPTRDEFFGLETARKLKAEGLDADVVLGNNVLAHVADLNGFVAGAAELLRPGGIVELEFPYVLDLVDHLEFDTIYHEHLCYFSAHAIHALFWRHGLVFTDVQRLPIHGGSLRVTAAREADPVGRARVDALLEREKSRGAHRPEFYADFGLRVRTLGQELVDTLRRLWAGGAKIVAYGASAKGSTLLNVFHIGGDLVEYVVDRSRAKQGKRTPGTRLEICSPERLLEEMPGYALLLTWNFADEILAQQEEYRRRGGKFIIPLPTVRIV